MKDNTDYSKTLIVRVDVPGLQYDINAIIKSFYPDKDVRVLEPGIPVHDEHLLELPLYMDVHIGISGTIRIGKEEYSFECDPSQGAKNSFKQKLYDVMCEITGRTLPWGNLTGVRPVKIAMLMIREGATDPDITGYLTGYHRVSDEKASLAVDIAHREESILSKLDYRNGYSLYIGIPFCPTTCLYCSFTSFAYGAWRARVDEYLNCLFKEIDYVSDSGFGIPDTIYIGGGTPTSLDEVYLERLLSYLTDRIDVNKCLEFTCEAGRPDSITPGKLKILKRYGVTRISVNPQTMQQKTLDIIGRRTTPSQVSEAFAMAREAGFDNINMDIILGLPGEGEEEVRDTLDQIRNLHPDSLTVHSLAIKRASALKTHLDEIGITALNNTDMTMKLASEAAAGMSMKPYYLYRQKNMSGNFENTGFAAPGKECIYNILIMEEVQSIIALGAGAVSKRVEYGQDSFSPVRITRAENSKDMENYLSRTDEMIDRKRELFA